MKMTRKELMDEMRQQDGDPKLKARQKARARAMAKQRALNNVKDASRHRYQPDPRVGRAPLRQEGPRARWLLPR